MNKIFLWIVLAVIILGLLLILLNTRMGQSGDAPVPADNSVSAPVKPAPPVTPGTPADGEKLAAAGVKPSPAAVERGFAFETGEETPATAENPAPQARARPRSPLPPMTKKPRRPLLRLPPPRRK